MNYLKTWTALAAVMLAGLAAPMAAANHLSTCPSADESLTVASPQLADQTDGATANKRIYSLSLAAAGVVEVREASANDQVKVTIWKQATHGAQTGCEIASGLSGTYNGVSISDFPAVGTFDLSAGDYFVEVMEDTGGSNDPDTFSILAAYE